MAIAKDDKQNFETILNAAKHGDLALLECVDSASGATLSVVCAVNRKGEELEFVPLAKLFSGNPYNEVTPPTPQ
jgi:Family of unknown function (DUF6117)